MEGKCFIKDSLVFNALAIFSYNTEDQNYRIESHLADGKASVATGKFNEDGKFVWVFKVPTGQIRYTIKIDNTTWNEYGEYSAVGSQWWKFIEMNLTKK